MEGWRVLDLVLRLVLERWQLPALSRMLSHPHLFLRFLSCLDYVVSLLSVLGRLDSDAAIGGIQRIAI